MSRFILSAFFLSIILFCSSQIAQAQDFDEGVTLYEQGNFSGAADIFKDLDTPEAILFLGKSYLGMGKYVNAKSYLHRLDQSATSDIYAETEYTLALAEFQLKEFGNALNRLHRLLQAKVKTKVVNDGRQLYNDILNYLTLNQRRKAFQQAVSDQVRYDIVSSSFGKVEYPVAKMLYKQLTSTIVDSSSFDLKKLRSEIDDSLSYSITRSYSNQIRAPRGITYNIGAALPSYSSDAPNYSVTQGLYFGYLLAAEQFNQDHTDKKVFIRYQNTAANADSAGFALTDLAWNYNIDAVLGPLLSEPAGKLASLAEEYQIPMLAPLANSDTLNFDNPYLYQANPTFSSHGRKMARYAVKNLGMDTLAVITERNSLGAASAYAFREEAEKLGASVPYFFVDNLEAKGYDLTDYTKYFNRQTSEEDSLRYYQIDGIYAPFTSQAASNLTDLLLVDLNAMKSQVTLLGLGSQEWESLKLSEERRGNRDIYFSESYYQNKKSEKVAQFREEFQNRFDMEPNRFAMIGYDVANFLLQTINRVQNPALLKNALKEQPLYEGLIGNIFFDGKHVNQEVKIFRISDQGVEPARF